MSSSNPQTLLIPLLLAAIGALLFWAFWSGLTGHEGERLAALALERVPESGAEQSRDLGAAQLPRL
jgi:hypothetical protein